jgi:hypothetical protein
MTEAIMEIPAADHLTGVMRLGRVGRNGRHWSAAFRPSTRSDPRTGEPGYLGCGRPVIRSSAVLSPVRPMKKLCCFVRWVAWCWIPPFRMLTCARRSIVTFCRRRSWPLRWTMPIGSLRPLDDDYFDLLADRYSHLRQVVPLLLNALRFRSSALDHELVEAIELLRSLNETGRRKVPEKTPISFVLARRRTYVVDDDGRIDRRFYELWS